MIIVCLKCGHTQKARAQREGSNRRQQRCSECHSRNTELQQTPYDDIHEPKEEDQPE